ncbi:MAG: hypothetical protein A2139_14635 [Desulfobacca sp. RBG_16_60_12]|nr:MAG: hypothetical protein A2139_14635 [Desulfobacca sp. RBG_16_60_12]
MKIPTRPASWLVIIAVYIAMTFVLSSFSVGPVFKFPFWRRWDLLAHFIEYGLLAWLILRYHLSRAEPARWAWPAWSAVLWSGGVGGLNELWQLHTPGRLSSVSDFAANLAGALVVVWLSHYWYLKGTKQTPQGRQNVARN